MHVLLLDYHSIIVISGTSHLYRITFYPKITTFGFTPETFLIFFISHFLQWQIYLERQQII